MNGNPPHELKAIMSQKLLPMSPVYSVTHLTGLYHRNPKMNLGAKYPSPSRRRLNDLNIRFLAALRMTKSVFLQVIFYTIDEGLPGGCLNNSR